MKKMMILAMMMVMTISANAMSYNAAKHEALFLSDKMAYELNLTAAQYEDVYEINLDYLMSLNGHGDVFGVWWERRNAELRYVLTPRQYDKYVALERFYRPVAWKAGGWRFAVYAHYNRGHFYNAHPKGYKTYRGGHNRDHGKPGVTHNDRHGADKHGTDRHGADKHGTDRHGADRHGADKHGANNNHGGKNGHFGGRR